MTQSYWKYNVCVYRQSRLGYQYLAVSSFSHKSMAFAIVMLNVVLAQVDGWLFTYSYRVSVAHHEWSLPLCCGPKKRVPLIKKETGIMK